MPVRILSEHPTRFMTRQVDTSPKNRFDCQNVPPGPINASQPHNPIRFKLLPRATKTIRSRMRLHQHTSNRLKFCPSCEDPQGWIVFECPLPGKREKTSIFLRWLQLSKRQCLTFAGSQIRKCQVSGSILSAPSLPDGKRRRFTTHRTLRHQTKSPETS